jgi:hypothetical protein
MSSRESSKALQNVSRRLSACLDPATKVSRAVVAVGEKRRSYPNARLSAKRATGALTSLLYGCTAERLAGFTAAGLAKSWNVSVDVAERMLVAARLERGL